MSENPEEFMRGEIREALENNIDVETFRMLATFEEKFLAEFDSRYAAVHFLRQHADRIKNMVRYLNCWALLGTSRELR